MSDARDALQSRERLDILGFGTTGEIEFHFPEELIVVIDEGDIDCDGLAHAGIGEMVGDIFAVGFVGESLAGLGQIVLAVGIMDVGQQFGTLAGQMAAPPESVAGRPQLRRIDIRLREHTATKQHGNLVGIQLIVLGFAAMNRLPRERVAQDKGNLLLGTEVRQPLPREHTFDADDEVFSLGSNDP